MNTRREFLQKISGSAIGLTILPTITSAACAAVPGEVYDGKVLNVAILGLGRLCDQGCRCDGKL